ncbi:MAG TPA: VTT domain-containing protein [Candidatus Levybacteria bacterium]|nr:VTT domain-containing protein [Candidatus Levybacteria bacterium]
MSKNSKTPQPASNTLLSRKKLFFVLLFVVSTIALLLPLFFKDQLRQVESFGLFGVFLINFFSSATIFLPSPGILSVPIASQIYNPLAVVLLGSLGSSLGEIVGFIFGHSTVQVLDAKKHRILFHLNKFVFQKYGLPITILLSAIPNPLVDGLGILAGMAGYPLHKFLFAVFLGRILRNIILVFFAGGF